MPVCYEAQETINMNKSHKISIVTFLWMMSEHSIYIRLRVMSLLLCVTRKVCVSGWVGRCMCAADISRYQWAFVAHSTVFYMTLGRAHGSLTYLTKPSETHGQFSKRRRQWGQNLYVFRRIRWMTPFPMPSPMRQDVFNCGMNPTLTISHFLFCLSGWGCARPYPFWETGYTQDSSPVNRVWRETTSHTHVYLYGQFRVSI